MEKLLVLIFEATINVTVVNSDGWQKCQLWQFTRFWWKWKLCLSTPTVERNVDSNYWQYFGSSESYCRQECQLPLLAEFWQLSLQKIPYFHLISWCRNFVEGHSFCIVSADLPYTMHKPYFSRKFLHQKIRWNYCVLRSVSKLRFQGLPKTWSVED